MEDQIFTPQETPTLDDVMNTEQEDVVYTPLDNVIDDEIHTQTEPSDVQIPESEEIETGEPIEVTIEDQIITPKKNRIDFQGYELDNISEADNENDVPSIKQVRDIVEEVESEKQDKLTAGDNITITDNVISATDTTYTAGDNISISDENVISATDTTYTAGDNITITDNVISATDTTYTAGSGLTLTDTEFSVGTITNSMIGENAVTASKIDLSTLHGYVTPANLTGQTYSGNYNVSDIDGWTITIPSSVQGSKYFVEASIPYASLGVNYKMLALSYSNNTQFATFVENTSSDVGLRIGGIATGTGSDLTIKVQIQLNGSGTTTGRVDGGYIRWERLS